MGRKILTKVPTSQIQTTLWMEISPEKVTMKLLSLALFGLVIAQTYAVNFFEVVVEEWELWKSVHQKAYANADEEKFRMKIFMENKQKIAKHNTRYHKGHHNYNLEMNHYGDLLSHEFQAIYNGYRHDLRKNETLKGLLGATYIEAANVALPKNVDWREKGKINIYNSLMIQTLSRNFVTS